MKKLMAFFVTLMVLLLPLNLYADAAAKAGIVFLAAGNSYAIGNDQQKRMLKRGSDILVGDTLNTGTNGQLQFRLNDNSSFTLKPNSQIKISEFSYQFNSKNNKSIIKIIQGGFRTITGAIGVGDNYQVQTPVAVIGVRGTDFLALFINNMLYTATLKGVISVTNNAGTFLYGAGQPFQYSETKNINQAPTGLTTEPAPLQSCQ